MEELNTVNQMKIINMIKSKDIDLLFLAISIVHSLPKSGVYINFNDPVYTNSVYPFNIIIRRLAHSILYSKIPLICRIGYKNPEIVFVKLDKFAEEQKDVLNELIKY